MDIRTLCQYRTPEMLASQLKIYIFQVKNKFNIYFASIRISPYTIIRLCPISV